MREGEKRSTKRLWDCAVSWRIKKKGRRITMVSFPASFPRFHEKTPTKTMIIKITVLTYLGRYLEDSGEDTKDAWDSTSVKNAISKFSSDTTAKISRSYPTWNIALYHIYYLELLRFLSVFSSTIWSQFFLFRKLRRKRDKLGMVILILKIVSKFFSWQISSESSLGKGNPLASFFPLFSYFLWDSLPS